MSNVVNLDVQNNEALQDDKISIFIGEMKTLSLILDGEFEVVQLYDNTSKLVCVGDDFPTRGKEITR